MGVVLDSSVTLASLFADEITPAVRETIALINTVGAEVPSFWRIEVANGLEMAVRRVRITSDLRDAALMKMERWLVKVDTQTSRYAWTTTKALAQKHHLTLYDAAYLELALRRDAALATLDKALRRAAETEGVLLLGL